MAFSARIIADSIGPSGKRLTTFESTFPRPYLAEFNTHRRISRNSASSRAIPVEKQIARVLADPFIPIHWGKNQKGMQAEVELTEDEQAIAKAYWKGAVADAVLSAKLLLEIGVHKQVTNRLLEPFMWQTVICSATEWDNFFNLRDHPAADPHMQKIAGMMRYLYLNQKPDIKMAGEWHLPLVGDIDLLELKQEYTDIEIARISSARCARVSYLTHDGRRDPVEDLKLADKLQVPVLHASPFEHAACAMATDRPSGNYDGWQQYRKMIPGEAVFHG